MCFEIRFEITVTTPDGCIIETTTCYYEDMMQTVCELEDDYPGMVITWKEY